MHMMTRTLLICFLCLGIILPKTTAALALVLTPNSQLITICTPTGIQTILLDGEGNPVEGQSIQSDPCLSAHADLTSPVYVPEWQRIARLIDAKATLFSTPHCATGRSYQRPPCRAPPVS